MRFPFTVLTIYICLARLGYTEDVVFQIDATVTGTAIPDVVYGTNSIGYTGSTLSRHGGNRLTGFNWENNASNAGSDYNQQSDSYLGTSAGVGSTTTPGAVLKAWVNADRAAGKKTLMTIPLAGFVAADMAGQVTVAQSAPSSRWKQVIAKKPTSLSLTPDVNDGAVYLDEMVNFLVSSYGKASSGGVAAYNLDNEPGLWSETHPRLHPAKATYSELAASSIAAAISISSIDSTAEIYGPTLYGWADYLTLQAASDNSANNSTYGSFAGYYLAKMKEASDSASRRLLHRFDLHWYPEARGDSRITSTGAGTSNDVEARLQAPRSLWDSTYTEKSWIAQDSIHGPVRLLPRMQEAVAKYYPETALAVTEYNYGAAGHISGGVAQADVLGILGRYGVAGCYWALGSDNTFVDAAFRLFRNYDGNGAGFGDLSLSATSSDNATASSHAARRSGSSNVVTIAAINRSRTQTKTARFSLALPNGQVIDQVRGWRLSGASTALSTTVENVDAASAFSTTLPAMSATMYEVKLLAGLAAWRKQSFGAQSGNSEVAGDSADPDQDGVVNLLEYASGDNPLQPTARPTIRAQASGAEVQVTFTRRKELTDVQLFLQSTSSLAPATWESQDPASLKPIKLNLDAEREQWTVSFPANQAARFFRLVAIATGAGNQRVSATSAVVR